MPDKPIQQLITGFEQDEDGHWVAHLACGHKRHVRHSPPWQNREWVVDEVRRSAMIGEPLVCGECVQQRDEDAS